MALRHAAVVLTVLSIASCGPVPDTRQGEQVDLRPPVLIGVWASGAGEISIELDEEASLVSERLSLSPPLGIVELPPAGKRLVIKTDAQSPGSQYVLQGQARDARGNTMSFLAELYGFNPSVPRLLINELITRGSGKHPDLVEIKATSDGNMGGVVIYQGSPDSFDNRLVFPSFPVKKGGFILVHFKPTGGAEELDETEDMAASGGLDASENAYDFWVPGGNGLAGNNGALSLYERPGGAVLDCVLYSNRTSTSDEEFMGFGSKKVLAWAQRLVEDGGWNAAGDGVTPEDVVNPEGSTATRSICRSSGSVDTDSPEDWHIVPTRKSSFGSENCDEAYQSEQDPDEEEM